MKRLLNSSFKLLVSGGLLCYLATRIDWQELSVVFTRTNGLLFAAAVLCFAFSNLLGAVQWHLLLRAQQLEVRFRQVLILYFVGVFFNNVLLGNIGGDAVRIYDLRRLTGQSSPAVAATVMDRFIGLLSTCTLALAAYPLIAGAERAWLVSLLVPVWAALLLLLAAGLSRRLGSCLERIAVRRLPPLAGNLVSRIQRSMVLYRDRGSLLGGALSISFGVQFCRVLVYWIAGLAIGMNPGLRYFVCFQPVTAIIAALPVSIGGLGVREGAMVGLFASIGIAENLSLAMSLLGYLAGIAASMLGGIAFVVRRIDPSTQRVPVQGEQAW